MNFDNKLNVPVRSLLWRLSVDATCGNLHLQYPSALIIFIIFLLLLFVMFSVGGYTIFISSKHELYNPHRRHQFIEI